MVELFLPETSLIKQFNNIAEKNLVPLILATSDAKDMERKDMLFERLGFTKVGSVFVEK